MDVGGTVINLAQASGTITVTEYEKLHLTAATGTIVVVDYTKLGAVTATATITVANYDTLAEGATVTINSIVLTEGVEWNAETSNTVTAHNIAAAITTATATTLCTADNADEVVTITANAEGTAANGRTVATSDAVKLLKSGNLAGGQNHAICTVNEIAYVEGTDWDAETSDGATATNLATAIGADECGAVNAGTDTITITAPEPGLSGNAILLATSDAVNLTISHGHLTGGYAAAIVTINGVTVSETADWTAETDNDTTASNLATAIAALDDVHASATDNVVTITADTIGTAGNAYTVATSDAVRLLKSGATLSGGSSGSIGTSGSPVSLFGIGLTASTSGAAVNVYNGTSTSDTKILQLNVSKNTSKIFKSPKGIVLPDGCFVSVTLENNAAPPSYLSAGYKMI